MLVRSCLEYVPSKQRIPAKFMTVAQCGSLCVLVASARKVTQNTRIKTACFQHCVSICYPFGVLATQLRQQTATQRPTKTCHSGTGPKCPHQTSWMTTIPQDHSSYSCVFMLFAKNSHSMVCVAKNQPGSDNHYKPLTSRGTSWRC